jgi:hypothetical protein
MKGFLNRWQRWMLELKGRVVCCDHIEPGIMDMLGSLRGSKWS